MPLHLRAGSTESTLPGDLATTVVEFLDAMMRGDTVEIEALPAELTTDQAADLLGESRPTVVSLVDRAATFRPAGSAPTEGSVSRMS